MPLSNNLNFANKSGSRGLTGDTDVAAQERCPVVVCYLRVCLNRGFSRITRMTRIEKDTSSDAISIQTVSQLLQMDDRVTYLYFPQPS